MSYGLTVTDAHSYGLTVTDAHAYGLTVGVTDWEYHEYPPALLFYDRLTDADGTLLENHTPTVGTGWTASRSGIEIASNKAHFQTGAAAPLIVDSNITADGISLTALIYPVAGGGEAGFVIRRTGAALTWHLITLTQQGGLQGVLQIIRRNPLATLATSGAISTIQAYPYILQVDVTGNTITATLRGYYNEVTTITATDATNAGTHTAGLYIGAVGMDMDEVQITPYGGQYGYSVLSPTNLWDNGYTTDKTNYRWSSPFARWKYTTDARRMVVFAWCDSYGYMPQYAHIGLWINGIPYSTLVFAADGETDFVVDLPPGNKTVELLAGAQQQQVINQTHGTWLRNVYFVGANTVTQALPVAPANQLLVYGDSIAVGANSTYPTSQGWPMLLRAAGQPTAVEAWGYRSLGYDLAGFGSTTAIAAQLAGYAPAKIWMAIGTNDYGLDVESAATFGAAYADLLDKLHTALPGAVIYCQTPLKRGSEGANGHGSTCGDYRTEIGTAANARAYCVLVDGTAAAFPQDPADLDADRLHPTTAGHVRYAAAVRAILGV